MTDMNYLIGFFLSFLVICFGIGAYFTDEDTNDVQRLFYAGFAFCASIIWFLVMPILTIVLIGWIVICIAGNLLEK